jgi:hypothetical protein
MNHPATPPDHPPISHIRPTATHWDSARLIIELELSLAPRAVERLQERAGLDMRHTLLAIEEMVDRGLVERRGDVYCGVSRRR